MAYKLLIQVESFECLDLHTRQSIKEINLFQIFYETSNGTSSQSLTPQWILLIRK